MKLSFKSWLMENGTTTADVAVFARPIGASPIMPTSLITVQELDGWFKKKKKKKKKHS